MKNQQQIQKIQKNKMKALFIFLFLLLFFPLVSADLTTEVRNGSTYTYWIDETTFELTVDNETIYLNQSQIQRVLNQKDTDFEVVTAVLNNNIINKNWEIGLLKRDILRARWLAGFIVLISAIAFWRIYKTDNKKENKS